MDDRQRELVAWALATEGHFSLLNQGKKRGKGSFIPHVGFANTDKELFDNFVGLVQIGVTYWQDRDIKWKPVWSWLLKGIRGQLLEFLEEIIPFLPAKKKQAKLLLEFCKLRRASTRKGVACKLGQNSRTPREYEIYQELRLLNKRGGR